MIRKRVRMVPVMLMMCGVSDETLRFEVGAAFDRIRAHAGIRPELR